MIHSMTGFGDAQTHDDGVTYRVEIRSLNNRYFKAAIKLPEPVQSLETEVEKHLRERLGRGSVTFTLRVRDDSPAAACALNTAALKRYVEALGAVADGNASLRIDLGSLLALPGVCQTPVADETALAAQREMIRKLTDEAIDKLISMREVEGESIRTDLEAQCAAIRQHLQEIQARSPAVVEEYHERLRARVQELTRAAELDLNEDALAREVAVFAERCDVFEEISRLSSHLDQFAEMCDAPDEIGRKLDFLTQEMLREANTIGSKANDARIARHIVEIKAAIDRIKEQVQNVE